jgi:hypothetical protein
MPLSMTGGLAHESLFEDIDIQWLEWVQAGLTSPDQKTSPRHTVLYRKMSWMKFKKYIIITREFMNRHKMFSNGGHM